MSKQHKRRQHRHHAPAVTRPASFTPVPVRARHDGWTPVRQVSFVRALAACGHIEEACAAVGMSPRSYYDLRARADSGSFRQAVDLALDHGIARLEDAMLGRAIHGVAEPIFYKGEQVGERRRYDERLGLALLRARRPERYGKWRDAVRVTREHPDGTAKLFEQSVRYLAQDAVALAEGRPVPDRPPITRERLMDDPEEIARAERRQEERERLREQEDERRREDEWQTYLDTLSAQTAGLPAQRPQDTRPEDAWEEDNAEDDAPAPDDAARDDQPGDDEPAAEAIERSRPGEPTLTNPPAAAPDASPVRIGLAHGGPPTNGPRIT